MRQYYKAEYQVYKGDIITIKPFSDVAINWGDGHITDIAVGNLSIVNHYEHDGIITLFIEPHKDREFFGIEIKTTHEGLLSAEYVLSPLATAPISIFRHSSTLKKVTVSNCYSVKDFSLMFAGCRALEYAEVDSYGGENFERMFLLCENLSHVKVKLPKSTSNVDYMFRHCDKLTTVDDSTVIDYLPDLTSIKGMFESCHLLTYVPFLNTPKCTDFSYVFADCKSLKNHNGIVDGAGINFMYMFENCTSLETIAPDYNESWYSEGERFIGMFKGCTSLKEIPDIKIPKAKDARGMFEDCSNLISCDSICIGQYTDVTDMFKNSTAKSPIFTKCNAAEPYVIKNNLLVPKRVNILAKLLSWWFH